MIPCVGHNLANIAKKVAVSMHAFVFAGRFNFAISFQQFIISRTRPARPKVKIEEVPVLTDFNVEKLKK